MMAKHWACALLICQLGCAACGGSLRGGAPIGQDGAVPWELGPPPPGDDAAGAPDGQADLSSNQPPDAGHLADAAPDVSPAADSGHPWLPDTSSVLSPDAGQPPGNAIYVDGNNGSDGNNGLSAAQAVRTIGRGVQLAQPGDTVLVHTATYHEVVRINKSGAPGKPITIRAAPGHSPVLDGKAGVGGPNQGLPTGAPPSNGARTNPKTGAYFVWGGLLDINGSHITWDGIDVIRSRGRGIRIFGAGVSSGKALEHVTIKNCAIRQHYNACNLIERWQATGVHNILYQNCSISLGGSYYPERRAASATADWSGAFSVKDLSTVDGASRNLTIQGCHIFNNWGEVLLADANKGLTRRITFQDNVCWDNWWQVYVHGAEDVVIQRNYVFATDADKADPAGFHQTYGITINGFESPTYGQRKATDVKVYNNVVSNLPVGISTVGNAGTVAGIQDVTIANNTVVGCDTGYALVTWNKSGCVFRNNISTRNAKELTTAANGMVGWTRDHNHWDSTPPGFAGAGDLIGDPLLVNRNYEPQASDRVPSQYELQPASSARNTGVDLAALFADDFFGRKRQAPWDMGMHELGAPGTP